MCHILHVNNITKSEKTNLEKVSKEDMNSNSQKDSEVLSYQEKQEKDLERILGKINGVGSVDVVINFQSSEVKVPAVDNSSQKALQKKLIVKEEQGLIHKKLMEIRLLCQIAQMEVNQLY